MLEFGPTAQHLGKKTIHDHLYDGSMLEDRLSHYFKQYVDAHPVEFFID